MREEVSVLWRLGIAWSLTMTAFGVIAPVTPLIMKDISGASKAARWQGAFTATTAASGLFLCCTVGYWSDRWGRMRLLQSWIAVFALATTCVLYADIYHSLPALWVARLPALSIAFVLLAALTSDLMTGPELLRANGYFGAVFGGSLLMGALASALLSSVISRVASLGFAVLCTCSATAIVWTVSSSKSGAVNKGLRVNSFVHAVRTINSDRLLRLLVVDFAILRVANVNMHMMFVLYASYRLGWGTLHTSISLGLSGSLGALFQFFGVRILTRYFSNVVPPTICLLCGNALLCVAFSLVTTSTAMYCVVVLSPITTVAISVMTSKVSALASEDDISGTAMGVVGSLQNLLEIFSSLLFGWLLSWVIATFQPHQLAAGLPYVANAFVHLGACALLIYAHWRYGKGRKGWETHHLMPPEDSRAVTRTADGEDAAMEERSSHSDSAT